MSIKKYNYDKMLLPIVVRMFVKMNAHCKMMK